MAKKKVWSRTLKILGVLLLLAFMLLVGLYIAIQSPNVQTYVAHKITNQLNKNGQLNVEVGDIEIKFFNQIKLNNLLILDTKPDTLAYLGSLEANFSYFSLFSRNIVLSNASIDNVLIDFNRAYNDTLFNNNILFSSPQEKRTTTTNNKVTKWIVGFEDFMLSNIKFVQNDFAKGAFLAATVDTVKGNFSSFDIANSQFDLSYLNIIEPGFSLINNFGNDSLSFTKNPFSLTIPITITSNVVNLKNGKVAITNKKNTKEIKTTFNPNDIFVDSIQAEMEMIYLGQDSIFTDLHSLFAKEKSSLTIQQLHSSVSLTNNSIHLDSLLLVTNYSRIDNQLHLNFSSFEDFKNFGKKVSFDANFETTKIDPHDVNYFVNIEKAGLRYPVLLSGSVYGKVSNLKARDILLKTGNRTSLLGDVSLNGLPNIEETFVSLSLTKLVTDYKDFNRIYGKLNLPSNFERFGRIVFTGKLDGFLNDFVTYGKLSTDIGVAQTDLNFKTKKNSTPSYSGTFTLTDFNVGKWLGIEDLVGKTSLQGKVNGKGLKLATLDVNIEGEVKSANFKDYNYQNIVLDGNLKNNFFKGNASIKDENVALSFSGLVDATQSVPMFNFSAEVEKLNLGALNIYEKPYILSGSINSNFSATSIDDVLGNLLVNNLNVSYNDQNYLIKKFDLTSNLLSNGDRRLLLKSDNISASAQGNFILTELPKSIKTVLFPSQNIITSPQEIRLDFTLYRESELLNLFLPQVNIPKNAMVGGNLNTVTETFFAAVDIPFIQYNDISIADLSGNFLITPTKIDFLAAAPQLYIGDSLFLVNTFLSAAGNRKNIIGKFTTAATNGNTGFNINSKVTNTDDVWQLEFLPSSILLNKTYWDFSDNNSIEITTNSIKSNALQITNEKSKLSLILNIDSTKQSIITTLNNIQLNDFSDFLREKNIVLQGEANGQIVTENLFENPAFSGNILVTDIDINDYKVGTLSLNATVDLPSNQVDVNGSLIGQENDVDISGTYSFDKKSTPKDLNILFKVNNFAFATIEDFIPEYIDNTSGTVGGELKLIGFRTKPQLLGYLDIDDVWTTVTYLQTRYNVKNHRVNFDKNVIDLGKNLIVYDEEGNQASGSGKILHKNFKDIRLDINVVSKKIQGLNTKVEDNEIFYGTAYLKGGANFSGLTTELKIYVYGESEPGTNISIPLEETGATNKYEFYTFIKKKKDKNLELIKSKEVKEALTKIKGVSISFDLQLDADCQVRLILDQAAGDVLEANGEGSLHIDVSKGGETVDFFGSYSILSGDYLFTLQNIINKRFRIEPNSNIQFNGPIEEAVISVNAIYNVRANTTALIQDLISSDDEIKLSNAKSRVPIQLKLNLTDKLSAPTINFDINILQIDPSIRNEVETKLRNIKLYENELNRQVFGLLVLNQFLPTAIGLESTTNNSGFVAGGAANTVSEFLSNQISRYFSDWLSYLVDDLDLNINYSSYDQNDLQSTPDELLQRRRELQLALTKRFLNDRISINVGGNIDFGQDNIDPENNATFFGGDASVEYAFTKSRKFRIKAFTNTDYDYFNQLNRTRAGVGISFKTEFDNFKDIKIDKDEFKIKEAEVDTIPTVVNEEQ